MVKKEYRKSSQFLMPAQKESEVVGEYGLYPTHTLGEGKVYAGFKAIDIFQEPDRYQVK